MGRMQGGGGGLGEGVGGWFPLLYLYLCLAVVSWHMIRDGRVG